MFSYNQYNTVMSEECDISRFGEDSNLTMEDMKTIFDLPDSVFTEVSEDQQLDRGRLGSNYSHSDSYSEMGCDTQQSSSGGYYNMGTDTTATLTSFSDFESAFTHCYERSTVLNPIEFEANTKNDEILADFLRLDVSIPDSSGTGIFTEARAFFQNAKDEAFIKSDSQQISCKKEDTHHDPNILDTASDKLYKYATAAEGDKELVILKEEDEVLLRCTVCSKPALKYCSYGGKVCPSCRSFFRRSVQSGYHSIFLCKHDNGCKMEIQMRKKCQYCRFQSCLRSGMKITWVLSDEERDRRFNKLKKARKMIAESNFKRNQSVGTLSVLYLSFSEEEWNILDDLKSKFQVPWLQNLLIFDRNAGFHFIEYALGKENLKLGYWETFKTSMSTNFKRNILPRFSELEDLSSHDVGQIMNSQTSGIAQFFRSCHLFHLGTKMKGKEEICPVVSDVVTMSSNPDIVTSLDLHGLLSRLDLSRDVSEKRMPVYEDIYPDGWAWDRLAEKRHKDAVRKIVNWPTDDKNVFDYRMVFLMTLILAFHADFYTLVSRDRVEKIQLKYIMLLQRYLRFKLNSEAANKKFLEAMLLIAETRQAWEISCDYRF